MHLRAASVTVRQLSYLISRQRLHRLLDQSFHLRQVSRILDFTQSGENIEKNATSTERMNMVLFFEDGEAPLSDVVEETGPLEDVLGGGV